MKSGLFTSRIAMGAVLSSTVLILSGCGGGGGSPAPSPTPAPPANNAPQITSVASATVAENSTGDLITITATDADGDAVNFSISGGADAALFSLSGGALSFTEAPNFDAFADADEDNVFEVIVQASDGEGGSANQTIAVTVTNEREGIEVRRVATGFDQPTGLAQIFTTTMLVSEKDGTVWSIDPPNGTQRVFDELNLPANRELIDIASALIGQTIFSPTGLIRDDTGMSLRTSLGTGNFNEVVVASGAPNGATGKIDYLTGNGLGSSGLLLIAIGDPDGSRAQTDGGYGSLSYMQEPGVGTIPADLQPLGVGLRSPRGIINSFDTFYLSDQGGSEEHEFNVVPEQNFGARLNFGWPFFEGNASVQSGAPTDLFTPQITYGFGTSPLSGEGPTDGVAARGSFFQPASVSDRLIFGDENGSIFTIGLVDSVPAFENRTEDFVPDAGTIDSVVDIALDSAGRIYILDADGELFVVEVA